MTTAPSYLDELDQLLLDQGDDCMLVSQLDGFLTGIAVCPKLIRPVDWLKHVWSGEDGLGLPEFDSTFDFQHFLDLIMRPYNAVLASLASPGDYEPILEVDTRNDDVLWEMWVEGFARAMSLAPESWSEIAASDDAGCHAALTGIQTLTDFAEGKKNLTRQEEDQWDREAPDLIPMWIEMLHAWRVDPNRPRSVRRDKVGRNDPCPCGSGKKYKKCCGLN